MVIRHAHFVPATAMVHHPLHNGTVCTRVECSSLVHYIVNLHHLHMQQFEISIFSFYCTGIASKTTASLNLPKRNLCNMPSLAILTCAVRLATCI